jgi:hypothetical protein
MSLVPLKSAVSLELVLDDPLACHNVGTRWSRYEILGVILEKGTVFFLHCGAPVAVGKRATESLRHCWERSDVVGGRHLEPLLARVAIVC